jgi:hypothetical protein
MDYRAIVIGSNECAGHSVDKIRKISAGKQSFPSFFCDPGQGQQIEEWLKFYRVMTIRKVKKQFGIKTVTLP